MSVIEKPQERKGVHNLPAIIKLAETYDLDASAFAFTVKAIAMPAGASDAEFVACCLVAREHGLNPLTKEIYFMKTKAGTIQPIVSVDGWIKKCNSHPQFDGMDLEDDRDANGKLTGMFCSIFRKDRGRPTRIREDLAECKAVGGPVWKTSEYRMMRNRVICQCARIAFGFSGIMDPDEFAAWQARDVTPTKQVLEMPDDVPDQELTPSPVDQTAQMLQDGNTDEPIADVDGFLAKLADDIALCDSAEELAEVAAGNTDMIARLPEAKRKAAEQMLKEAAE